MAYKLLLQKKISHVNDLMYLYHVYVCRVRMCIGSYLPTLIMHHVLFTSARVHVCTYDLHHM